MMRLQEVILRVCPGFKSRRFACFLSKDLLKPLAGTTHEKSSDLRTTVDQKKEENDSCTYRKTLLISTCLVLQHHFVNFLISETIRKKKRRNSSSPFPGILDLSDAWHTTACDLDQLPGEQRKSPCDKFHLIGCFIRGCLEWFTINPIDIGSTPQQQ